MPQHSRAAKSLKVIIDQAKKTWPELELARINGSYEDVLILVNEIQRLEKLPADIGATRPYCKKASCFLKALHQMAAIYFSVFLHELKGRPCGAPSLQKFLDTPNISNEKAYQGLLGPYCVEIYRHKLVTHQDYYRIGAATRSPNGIYRLVPHASSAILNERIKTEVDGLRAAYTPKSSPRNTQELAENLFYGIPLPPTWPKRAEPRNERQRINKIIDVTGCKSMSAVEILAAVDAFNRNIIGLPKEAFFEHSA